MSKIEVEWVNLPCVGQRLLAQIEHPACRDSLWVNAAGIVPRLGRQQQRLNRCRKVRTFRLLKAAAVRLFAHSLRLPPPAAAL